MELERGKVRGKQEAKNMNLEEEKLNGGDKELEGRGVRGKGGEDRDEGGRGGK